ncbi:hypothetical protein [Neptuniibacter sp. QD37_11]|uniref:hypothetical protein n=1 Tax=Neptuniibacter sp. QD37_11 TaxID=3398209 RepID=UPI0039F52FE6
MLNYFTFVDKFNKCEFPDPGASDPLIYKPEGIVLTVNYPLNRKDGCDLLVMYQTPLGIIMREYRAISDVNLSETSEENWKARMEFIESSHNQVASLIQNNQVKAISH